MDGCSDSLLAGTGWLVESSWKLLIDEDRGVDGADGSSVVVGSGRGAYFLRVKSAPEVCRPNTPLTIHNISVYRAPTGAHFDLSSRGMVKVVKAIRFRWRRASFILHGRTIPYIDTFPETNVSFVKFVLPVDFGSVLCKTRRAGRGACRTTHLLSSAAVGTPREQVALLVDAGKLESGL